MPDAVVVAVITGVCAIIGSVITGKMASDKAVQQLNVNQAVTDTKIDNLTEEVRKHNNFATKIPVIEEQIRVINHRIEDLEKIRSA